jgi:Tir chaperone family protein CesT
MNPLAHVIREFGEKIGIPQLAFDDRGFCQLAFDDRTVVQIQANDEAGTCVLFSLVATLEQSDRLPIYESLLQANLFWSGTDGATLGVEPQTGSVFLARQLPQQVMNLPTFETMMESFVSMVEFWAEELARPRQPLDDPMRLGSVGIPV